MKYEKIEKDGFRIHLIKTKKFKTITVGINFKRKIKKDEITLRRFLSSILLESSNKYPTRRSLEKEIEDLYGLSISENNYISGNYDVMEFDMTLLNEKYTEAGMNKRSIEFLLQLICNPDIKNNCFNKDSFSITKNILNDDIKSIKDYPGYYSIMRLKEKMAPNKPFSYNDRGYLKDLKKIDEFNLYKYYQDFFKNDILDIIIVGEIDDSIIEVFNNYFSIRKNNNMSDTHFMEGFNTKKEQLFIESLPINQSKLVIGCSLKDLTEFELRYVLNVYSYILGGSGDSLLFKNVREENSLCYNISSTYNIVNKLFVISAGIDGNTKDKTISLIKENLEKMKNGEFDDNEILKAKTIFKNSCISLVDSPKNIKNVYMSHVYLNSDLLDTRCKKIDEVTKDMVISLANKINIHTIYLLKGDLNEKEIS